MTDTRYYIKHPNGRERIEAKDDRNAMSVFKRHWTASAAWNCDGKRELVKETREIICTVPVTGE